MKREDLAPFVGGMLHQCMVICRRGGISFDACLSEARKQFAREIREQAENTPLPTK